MTKPDLESPFVYFGGKSAIAMAVWERFGSDVTNYVEPFFGSGAVLLSRPEIGGIETVNDADGLLANFWRAVKHDPDAVAEHADWPVNENDLHARHAWLVGNKANIVPRLEGDPDWFDPKAAGWWVWGINMRIGGGWCSGVGPWMAINGELVNTQRSDGKGIHRKLPHLGSARGIHRKLPHLGDAGTGIHRKLPHLGNAGKGEAIREWFAELAARLRNVRVCCGDWSRVCGPSVTFKHGLTAVFLDPPYLYQTGRAADIYAHDSAGVAADVRRWAIENGDNPLMRIALCGYVGEHEMPKTWSLMRWSAKGGYDGHNTKLVNNNKHREAVWFSPHCLAPSQGDLLAWADTHEESQ